MKNEKDETDDTGKSGGSHAVYRYNGRRAKTAWQTGENITSGEVYDTATEAVYGDCFRKASANRLAGSPLEAECADGVDTATGHLILSRNDLSLEGTGGMDFELNRYYDSNEANLGHATVEYAAELDIDTIYVNYKAQDGSERRIIASAALSPSTGKPSKISLYPIPKRKNAAAGDTASETQRTKIVSGGGSTSLIETVTPGRRRRSGEQSNLSPLWQCRRHQHRNRGRCRHQDPIPSKD